MVTRVILRLAECFSTWQPQYSGTDQHLFGVYFANAEVGWAVEALSMIVATRDGGATWQAQTSGTDQILFGVHFANAELGWAVGDEGTIVATRDGGATWQPQTSGTDRRLWGVHFATGHGRSDIPGNPRRRAGGQSL